MTHIKNEAATSKSSPSSVTSSLDGTVRSPARGYHTYSDGSLNVTPKGKEKEMYALHEFTQSAQIITSSLAWRTIGPHHC